MNASPSQWHRLTIASMVVLIAWLAYGCVATGGGYGYDGGVGIGLGYYEPYGSYYGGWAPGYRVGPIPRGNYRPDRGGGRPTPHAYRSPPGAHAVPSIPSRPRPRGTRPQ